MKGYQKGLKKIHTEPSTNEDVAQTRVEHVAFIVQHCREQRNDCIRHQRWGLMNHLTPTPHLTPLIAS